MSGIFDDFLRQCAEDCVNGESGEMDDEEFERRDYRHRKDAERVEDEVPSVLRRGVRRWPRRD